MPPRPSPPRLPALAAPPVSSSPADPAAVADRLHSAAIHLLRQLRKQDEAMGLTPSRASALSVIAFAGPVTLGRLAQAEQVSAPTITRLVTGLERDGLIARETDTHDRRVVWLRATPKGVRRITEGRRRRVAALAADLARLDADTVRLLGQAAEIIAALGQSRT